MSALAALKYDDDVKETKDTIGGGFSVRTSGVYDATIKMAYLGKSAGGAMSLPCIFDIDGSEYRETLYLTNKEGKPYYLDKDGAKHYLAGFLNGDALALLTTGKPLADCATERKVVKLYNFEQKKDIPTEVDCLTALIGQKVKLGVLQELSFKSAKQPDGTYKETAETREANVIDKVFHATSGKTVNEFRAKVAEAEFMPKWAEKWTGKVKDKTAGKTPAAGTPRTAQAATAKPTTSLFA
jgi:hypothetical protein